MPSVARLNSVVIKRGILAALGVLMLSACGSSLLASPGDPPATTSLPQMPSHRAEDTVAAYFRPPQAYPGPIWTRNGRSVGPEELNAIAGPGHCEWQTVTFLHVGWPLGTVAATTAESRQFVRDPSRVLPRPVGEPLTGIALPRDAQDTGYRHGDLQLWLSPSDPSGAYLRVRADVERWPRGEPAVVCS